MPQQTNLNPRPRTWRAVPAASFISIERKLPILNASMDFMEHKQEI